MYNDNQALEYKNGSKAGSVLAGLLIGAAAGAAAMLLLAPQSGSATRKQIADKGIELRDRTAGVVDEAMGQLRAGTSKLVADGRKMAGEMKEQGQELLAGQLDKVSAAAQAGKKAVQTS